MRPGFLLLLLPALLTGCPEPTLTAINDTPIAEVYVHDPSSATAPQRLAFVPTGMTTWLDGSLSSDGDSVLSELTLQFSFDAVPEGSAVTDEAILPAAEHLGYATFVPDVPGTYFVSLVVVDRKDEASEPAYAVVEAVPAEQIEVQLDWSTPRVDLDLHLVAPDGSYFSDDDCFSWNPNPNWGDEANADDDPKLDGDADGEGAGPYRETIGLTLPGVGPYRVLVHHYLDHGAAVGLDPVAAEPSLRVSVGGEVVFEDALDGALFERDVWVAGLIEPEAGFASLGAQIETHADLGGPDYNQ